MIPRAVSNPPNPWQSHDACWLPDMADLPPEMARPQVFEEQCKSILSKNHSPDIGFNYSMNVYRGCAHACAYCYARPTHQYLDFGAGSDFETKIIVKLNAASRLREAFEKKSWQGELVAMSGNTDCYQPLEAHYGITRACLQEFLRFQNPLGIITKSTLIRRDLDLLALLARKTSLSVAVSVPFWEESLSTGMEPGAPKPAARIETIRLLAQAGIKVGVMVAPIIPGLSEDQVPEILERAKAAGASQASYTLLRLPAEVKPVFFEALETHFPSKAKKVINQVLESRGGEFYRSGFKRRHHGEGESWAMARQLFRLTSKKLGLEEMAATNPFEGAHHFVRPRAQMELF